MFFFGLCSSYIPYLVIVILSSLFMINGSIENYVPTEELKTNTLSTYNVDLQKADQQVVKTVLTNNPHKKFTIPIVQTLYDDILSFKPSLNPIIVQKFPNPPPFK